MTSTSIEPQNEALKGTQFAIPSLLMKYVQKVVAFPASRPLFRRTTKDATLRKLQTRHHVNWKLPWRWSCSHALSVLSPLQLQMAQLFLRPRRRATLLEITRWVPTKWLSIIEPGSSLRWRGMVLHVSLWGKRKKYLLSSIRCYTQPIIIHTRTKKYLVQLKQTEFNV